MAKSTLVRAINLAIDGKVTFCRGQAGCTDRGGDRSHDMIHGLGNNAGIQAGMGKEIGEQPYDAEQTN